MTRTFRSALMAAGLAAVAAAPAAAQQGCGDMVDRFAAAQNLTSTAPPVAAPPAAGTSGGTMSDSGPSMSDKLSQSGGVLAPPATGGNEAVIEPPRGAGNGMPTAPSVAPRPGSGAGSSADTPTGTSQERAAHRAQLESLVTAARAAARNGDERLCMESLAKAQALSERGRGAGGGG